MNNANSSTPVLRRWLKDKITFSLGRLCLNKRIGKGILGREKRGCTARFPSSVQCFFQMGKVPSGKSQRAEVIHHVSVVPIDYGVYALDIVLLEVIEEWISALSTNPFALILGIYSKDLDPSAQRYVKLPAPDIPQYEPHHLPVYFSSQATCRTPIDIVGDDTLPVHFMLDLLHPFYNATDPIPLPVLPQHKHLPRSDRLAQRSSLSKPLQHAPSSLPGRP